MRGYKSLNGEPLMMVIPRSVGTVIDLTVFFYGEGYDVKRYDISSNWEEKLFKETYLRLVGGEYMRLL